MGLKAGNTKWVLFLASHQDAEQRHIFDLAFGVQCLELAGIQSQDIFIYVDSNDRSFVSQLIGKGTANTYAIRTSSEFFSDQAHNLHQNLMLFVTGHGGIQGIDAAVPITPTGLLQSVKSSPNLKHAVLYLGQCYAGTFNYIPAGRSQSQSVRQDPDVIVIGATSLHQSLSVPTQEQLGGEPISWSANLFLLHIFKWISNPVDVDGDGKFTVMDSYKYAGVMTNETNKNLKAFIFKDCIEAYKKYEAAEISNAAQNTLESELAKDAAFKIYIDLLNIHYVHQESWILNAIPAQSLEF